MSASPIGRLGSSTFRLSTTGRPCAGPMREIVNGIFYVMKVATLHCARHFAQVRWIVGIEASPAGHRLNGAIGWYEH